jgi:DNA-binding LytR/AlgR family response regulator
MGILILEDNQETLKVLNKIVRSVAPADEIYLADNVADAYRIAMESSINVFLIDIVLDTKRNSDTSGIKYVEKIRGVERYFFTPVIFITSLEDPELYTYRNLHGFGYIEKPFHANQVAELVKQALKYQTQKEDETTLFFRKDGILYPAPCKNISYIELVNRMLHVHMTSGEELVMPYKTFKEVLSEANYSGFVQCSRSCVVNRHHIANIDKPNRLITMRKTREQLEIGITFAKRFYKEMGI